METAKTLTRLEQIERSLGELIELMQTQEKDIQLMRETLGMGVHLDVQTPSIMKERTHPPERLEAINETIHNARGRLLANMSNIANIHERL